MPTVNDLTLSKEDVIAIVAFALHQPARDTVPLSIKTLPFANASFEHVLTGAKELDKRYFNQFRLERFLYHVGENGRKDLLENLARSSDAEFRTASAAALAKMKFSPPPEAVSDALDSADWAMIALIVPKNFGEIDLDPKYFVPLLDHSLAYIRLSAAKRIAARKERFRFEELFKFYETDRSTSTELWIEALAEIDADAAATAFIDQLGKENSYHAFRALEIMGARAVDALLHAYRSRALLRHRYGSLVARLAGERAISDLIAALQDRKRAVRASAEAGLNLIGAPGVDAVLLVLDGGPAWAKLNAVRVLGRLRDQKALQKLIQLRATDDLELRQAAINAIGALRSEESYAALAQIFETGEWRDRRAVIESLHQDSSPNALKIIKIALGDRDWQVRLAVTEWVDYRIEWAQPGREVLSALCNDTWESVAAAARTRLQRLENFLSREARARDAAGASDLRAPEGGAVKPTAPYDADEQVSAATSPNDIAPISITDRVGFTVTAPTIVPAGTRFLLDVWIHQDDQLQLRDVFDRARRASPTRDQSVRTKGPIAVDRDTILSIRLAIDSFALVLEDRVFWTGEIGNATFPIAVPQDASQGTHIGVASIAANGLLVANVYFEFEVCHAKQRDQAFQERFDITSQEQRLRSAFASYASEDRNRVLARLQGILKALPDLDIFLDVMSLRSGDFWEPRLRKEIKSRDVFYLFWSAAARRSDWVTREWRIALEEKGINYIDPVPLDPPDVAPPPPELAARHFNDGILAFFKAD